MQGVWREKELPPQPSPYKREVQAVAKEAKEGWTVRAIGVQFIDGKRIEKPLEDFTAAERREIAERMNEKALWAAGYRPVKSAAAM